MTKLYFNSRDLLRAARLGWSGKKMWISFIGILIGYVGYLILSYVALLANGMSFGEIWGTYGLYPYVGSVCLPWYSWVLYVLGVLWAIAVLLLIGTAVAKITYRQLKGDDFYSMGDAKRFMGKNWKAAIFAPVVVFGMIAFLIICGIIIGALGRIPYVGELGFSIGLFFIFAVSLFVVFLGIVFGFSFALSPAIVGTAEEDTLETVIQLFSTLWSQPWRLVLYQILLGFYIALSTAILSVMSLGSLLLINGACGLFMGDRKMGFLTERALQLLPSKCPAFDWLSGIATRIWADPRVGGQAIRVTESISGWIAGITLILIVGFVLSYGFSIWIAGQSLIYIILRQKKDDENLLERKDKEEQEEERKREEEEKKRQEEEKKREEERKKAEEAKKAEEEKKESKEAGEAKQEKSEKAKEAKKAEEEASGDQEKKGA